MAELAPVGLRATVPEHLRALSRKELLRPDRSDFAGDEAFRFRHLLIRDAAYSAMPKEARADLHERFAAWLERVSAEHVAEYEEILGYHLERAYTYRRELGPIDGRSENLGDSGGPLSRILGYRALERGDITAGTKLLRVSGRGDAGGVERSGIRRWPITSRPSITWATSERASELAAKGQNVRSKTGTSLARLRSRWLGCFL